MNARSFATAMPSPADVVAAIKANGCEPCIYVPTGAPVDPPEIWIGSIGVWARNDGSYYSADYGRGYCNPKPADRRAIAKAISAALKGQPDADV